MNRPDRHFGNMRGFSDGKPGKDEWLTPPELLAKLGNFDLDPCAPIVRPWDTAKKHYTRHDNGLMQPWHGRVWLNPPYGSQTGKWLHRLADHGDGIALIFARTETKAFFDGVWDVANAVLFLRGRIHFCDINGAPARSAGAPSCLVAFGGCNVRALLDCGLPGKLIVLR